MKSRQPEAGTRVLLVLLVLLSLGGAVHADPVESILVIQLAHREVERSEGAEVTRVRLSVISVADRASAAAIVARLDEGASFSHFGGRDIGWAPLHGLRPELRHVVESMEVGDHSSVVLIPQEPAGDVATNDRLPEDAALVGDSAQITATANGMRVFLAPASKTASPTKKGKARLHVEEMHEEGSKDKMPGPELIAIDGTTIRTRRRADRRQDREFYLAPGWYDILIGFDYVHRYESTAAVSTHSRVTVSLPQGGVITTPPTEVALGSASATFATALSGRLEVRLQARAGYHYYLEMKGRIPRGEIRQTAKFPKPTFHVTPDTTGSLDICLVESESRPKKKGGEVVACAEVSYSRRSSAQW